MLPTRHHRAASAGRVEALRVLIEEGRSKVDARNKEGSTPLLLAAESGCQPAALYLASRGADVEVREVRGPQPALPFFLKNGLPLRD